MKKLLRTTTILACPDFWQSFILQTDASDTGPGLVLTQTIDGQNYVIAYASKGLSETNKNPTADKKYVAVI